MDLNSSQQQDLHLSHYWNVVRKRWKVAVAILTVVMIGTFLASYFSKPLYRSTIQIQIERESRAVTVEDIFGIAASEQEFLQTQYVLLKSRGLALRVVEDHKLWNDRELYPPGVAGKTPKELEEIKEGIAGMILGGISIEPVRNTSLVEISYVGGSPQVAQKIADAWGESFIRMNIAKKLETVQQASDFLTTQISTIQNDLETSRSEMQAYAASRGIVAVEGTTDDVVMQRLEQLNRDVAGAQSLVYEKQAAYNALQRTSADAVASDDPLVMRLTEEYGRVQREYSEKRAQYLEGHPVMKQLAQQVEKMRTSRAAAVQQAYSKKLEAARAEFSAAVARETSARGAYNQQKTEAQRLNVDAGGYHDLQLAVQTKQGQLATLQKQLSETQVAARLSGSASSNIHLIDKARLPGGRFNLSMTKNLRTAFPLGLILGFAAIFFLEYMDRSIKNPEELEKLTQFASLGIIPSAESMGAKQYGYGQGYGRSTPGLRAVESDGPTAGVELIPHTDARSPIAEAYRAFRTSLLLASANSPKVIVITSSFAREGKTTTSVNLATVLAQMGKPVLLVDADLRRPRLQKVFTGKMNLGLVNYLAANIPLDDIIQSTEVPNLSVVLSGPIPPNPSELLASDRMKHLIEEVRNRFAYVIFDSPPVLAVTDAIVLAANADGVVLTVHGGQTPRELVQRSAERLRQANIPVLGALLNNLDLHQYGYTYRKGYFDYYESTEEEQSAAQARKSV
jgi:succinoglycan biosynthesis transport protein ExoP